MEDLSIDEIRDHIIKFKNDPDVQKLENFYYTKSFSEILGVSRREISHSAFISWLLNNKETHNLGGFSIRKLFDIILKYSSNKLKNNPDIYNALVTDDYEIEQLYVEREKVIQYVGRLDIYVEMLLSFSGKKRNLKLIIENKVESKENNDQTTNYYNHFNIYQKSDELIIYLFLTPISTPDLEELEEIQCHCKEFIQINYQSLVDYLIEPALNQNISNRTKNILTEYMNALSQPSLDDDIDGHQKKLIMALGNEERELLKSFWTKHQKLIHAAIYARSSDGELSKDERDNYTEFLDRETSNKDRSTFNIKYGGKYYAKNFKKSDIGHHTVKLLEHKNMIDDDIIQFLREDRSCSFFLLKKQGEFTDTEIKYRKYKTNDEPELVYNNEGYYVARNWGINNIDRFILKFTGKFPGLEYETN